jgi:uncharacterized protein (DUF2147 family)
MKIVQLIKCQIAFTIMLSGVIATSVSAQMVVDPSGSWAAKDGSVVVKIAPCDSSEIYCAKIVEEKLEAGAQSKIGQTVVQGLKLDKKKGWRGTYVADGASYRASAKFRGVAEVAFRICAFAFLCETQVFLKQ